MTENKGRVWGQDRAKLRGGEERLEDGFLKKYSILRREALKGIRKRLGECEIAGIYHGSECNLAS